MWHKLFLRDSSVTAPARLLLGYCRQYGYIHVPKKKPPHPLGPATLWRKCFVVQNLTEISDPLTKYQWLTKSTLEEGLPQSITSRSLPSDSLVDSFEERACDFLAYQMRRQYNGKGPCSPDTVSGLLQSTLSSIWPLAGDAEYQHLRDSHMTPSPEVECYWRRDGESYLSRTRPLYVMHADMALGLFCKSDYIGGGVPPVRYTPLHLGVFQHCFDQILPFGGSRNFGPFTLAHTVFVMDQKNHTPEGFYTHGLIQLFAQSAAEAVQIGFGIDQDLLYPLVTQGIVTNGQKFTFVCFQLNTLDMRREADAGKCNVFWAGPSLQLYDSTEPGEGLRNFNRECAELIIKFLLHRPVRSRLMRRWSRRSMALNKNGIELEAMRLAPVEGEIEPENNIV